MEYSFDLGKLLRDHAKKHKAKPSQFLSVAGGVQKRLETNQKYRKSSRLTYFDSARNLPRWPSPAPPCEVQLKSERRKQQLEKWKEEKEKKKKEAAAQRKKPFLTGVPHATHKFVSLPSAKPSTSGRVTRSQTSTSAKPLKEASSFAPKNAKFNPPQLKNYSKLPYVNPMALKPQKHKKSAYTFEPILPTTVKDNSYIKQTRSRTQVQRVEGKKVEFNYNVDTRASGKCKPAPTKYHYQSSSSSEMEVFSKTLPSLPSQPSQSSFNSTETDSSTEAIKKIPVKSRSRKPITKVVESSNIRKSTRTLRSSLPHELTPKSQVPKSESSSEERLRSPKNQQTPEQIAAEARKSSPRVTMSRGKDNARREMKMKLEEGLLDDDCSDIDNIDHFRQQLASEIKRMTEMCETWDKILEQTVLPDSIQESVLGAVGQARLLMSQKLRQFATLVERCARPEPGVALVTPADLHGFWDMVFMQVENVDMRFKKLEELRARGWAEELPVTVGRKPAAARPRAKPAVAGHSRIKDLIAAARKAKKDQPAKCTEKTFEAGFFCVKSPVRSPACAPGTPTNKPSLLKAVLSSEAQKASASKNSASFAMLRASVLGKNMECDGVAPLPQTPPSHNANANATPGRSILKQSTNKAKKSIKVVLFDQSDSDIDASFTVQLGDRLNQVEHVGDAGKIQSKQEFTQDVEKKERDGKENSVKKSRRLTRQDNVYSPVNTRSRRKASTSHVTDDPTETDDRNGKSGNISDSGTKGRKSEITSDSGRKGRKSEISSDSGRKGRKSEISSDSGRKGRKSEISSDSGRKGRKSDNISDNDSEDSKATENEKSRKSMDNVGSARRSSRRRTVLQEVTL